MKEPLTFIDLFSGAGGFSLGFHEAGMKGIFAIERDPMAFETLRYNLIQGRTAFDWPSWLPVAKMDIRYIIDNYREELRGLRGKVDLVAGGPPCQGFSTAGRRVEHDERNQMFREYVKFVELVEPRMILFENVPGFNMRFGGQDGMSYSSLLSRKLGDIGYEVPAQSIYDFSEFGVPQSRKRLIIFAMEKSSDPDAFHERMSGRRIPRNKISVESAISDLRRVHGEMDSPDSRGFKAGLYGEPTTHYQREMRKGANGGWPDSHRFANHSGNIVARFSGILKLPCRDGKPTRQYINSLGLRKRDLRPLGPALPSPTLTTLPDDYIHYDEPRILTVREYARLQSFPDWFEFKGKYTTGGKWRALETPRYTQVANAVPPIMSNSAASTIKEISG